MIQKSDITRAEHLVAGLVTTAEKLVKAGDLVGLITLVTETETVVNAYLADFNALIPVAAVTPFPKNNIFNQLSWVGKNLGVLLPLFSGVDPFTDARHEADALAAKYSI